MLNFFGRGSAFTDEHNNAFFIDGEDLILLDCSMTAYRKVKRLSLEGIKNLYILVTHTHGDHISGIGMVIDYEFFIGKIPVTVVAPSEEVREDLAFLLKRLEGCGDSWYSLITVSSLSKKWFNAAIATTHSPSLQGRCFGYNLTVDGRSVTYTGDSRTLEPFMPYLKPGSILYTEASAYVTEVHLYAGDLRDTIKDLVAKGIEVYVMHLDNETKIMSLLKDSGAKLAPLFDDDTSLNEILDLSYKLYEESSSCKNDSHGLVFERLTELGRELVGAERASFWRWDKRLHKLWTTSATGVDKIVIPDNTGLVGKAIQTKKVLVTNDPYNDPDFNSDVDKSTGFVTKSILVIPVANVNGDFIGAFQLVNKIDGNFNKVEDVRKISLPAVICGLALESDTFLDDAHHDRLTKLKNRMGFYSDFDRIFSAYLVPDSGKTMSLFMCDIDKFKDVNDTYGHNAGDAILSQMAEILQRNCTDSDMAYRWGGEEFVMIMCDKTLEECRARAEDIRLQVMDTDFDTGEELIKKTVSFGCALFDPNKTIEDNIDAADDKLYIAKESGRNRVIS